MTRQEEITQAADKDFEIESVDMMDDLDFYKVYRAGVIYGENHPISPWISVEDDLPCNHEELIDTTRHCTVSKDVIVRHKDGSVAFERMMKNYKSQWIFLSDVTHWTQIPELPKE